MPAINKKNKLPIAKIFAFTSGFFSESGAAKTGEEPSQIDIDEFEKKWSRFAEEREYGALFGNRNKQMGQLYLDVCDFFGIPREANADFRIYHKRLKT